MPSNVKFEISIDESSIKAIDAELAKIDIAARGPAIGNAIRSVGKMISKRTADVLPKPGYTKYTRPKGIKYQDKDGLKPLGETLATKVITVREGVVKVGIIGYAWPAGNHGHLVEQGHDLVKGGKKDKGGTVIGRVEPTEYLVRIVAETRQEQQNILISSVTKALKVR